MSNDPERVTVSVETLLGARYIFPDVDPKILKETVPESGRIPENQPSLQIISAYFAILSVPLIIVRRVWVNEGEKDGKVVWDSDA